jgi:hypothetical protein
MFGSVDGLSLQRLQRRFRRLLLRRIDATQLLTIRRFQPLIINEDTSGKIERSAVWSVNLRWWRSHGTEIGFWKERK